MKSFASIMSSYTGKSFEEYTCTGFIVSAYKDMGVNLPTSYEDINLDNYLDEFKKDSKRVTDLMMDLFKTIGSESSIKYPKIKDLIVIEQENGGRYPGIYLGKKTAIASYIKTGVTVIALNDKEKIILSRKII